MKMMFNLFLFFLMKKKNENNQKISSKIKGAIEIASITDIKKQDKISFKVIFPGRDFELKSKKPEECDEWI